MLKAAKAIVGFLVPMGAAWLATKGIEIESAALVTVLTGLITGLAVYFVPNAE